MTNRTRYRISLLFFNGCLLNLRQDIVVVTTRHQLKSFGRAERDDQVECIDPRRVIDFRRQVAHTCTALFHYRCNFSFLGFLFFLSLFLFIFFFFHRNVCFLDFSCIFSLNVFEKLYFEISSVRLLTYVNSIPVDLVSSSFRKLVHTTPSSFAFSSGIK